MENFTTMVEKLKTAWGMVLSVALLFGGVVLLGFTLKLIIKLFLLGWQAL
jgi:hypothetical protein